MPLACVVRATEIVDYAAPLALTIDTCYCDNAGSFEEELIKRSSHSHPLFKVYNAAVHCVLEEATRSTTCSASIKSFQKEKDGRNEWSSIVKQHAGNDQWKH